MDVKKKRKKRTKLARREKVVKSKKMMAISGRKIGFGDMFKRLRGRWIREEWNERGRAIMRGRRRERGERGDRDDFLFRQTHCGSFIIFPRQLPRPPALSLPSLFPSLSLCISLSPSFSPSLSVILSVE